MLKGVLPCMDRLDLRRHFKHLYQPSAKRVEVVDVPELKFASKGRSEDPIDYSVMPLEALWWAEDGQFDVSQPGNWKWTAMILQPDHITDSMFEGALGKLRNKRPSPALDRLRFAVFHEGLCMQTMHVGPYSEEPATLAKMEAFARENDYVLCGRHHEIYLGDPRRSAPEKLKTILRHPIQADR